jgi:hypothetical protein
MHFENYNQVTFEEVKQGKTQPGVDLFDRKMVSTSTPLTASDHYDNLKWVSSPPPKKIS